MQFCNSRMFPGQGLAMSRSMAERRLRWCSDLATISLPVPASPVTRSLPILEDRPPGSGELLATMEPLPSPTASAVAKCPTGLSDCGRRDKQAGNDSARMRQIFAIRRLGVIGTIDAEGVVKMKTAHSPTIPGGCAVVLEPESSWPAKAFAATPDRDCVVVIPVDKRPSSSALVERFVTHSSEFERSGAKLRTIILACGRSDEDSNTRRSALVKSLLPLLTAGDGRLVLTNDSSAGPSNDELFEFVETMSSDLHGSAISIVANDPEVVPSESAAPVDSGIFSLSPEIPGEFDALSATS